MSQGGSFSLWERVCEYKSQWSSRWKSQHTQCVHYVTLRKAWWMRAFYLLLLQWIGSSCFVSQQKAEIISRIWISKIHVTILIILLFCFFSSLFCWKVWEAQYRLLQPIPPQRRQVRWDTKNLSLKTNIWTLQKLLRRRGKNCCQFSLK